MQAFQVGDYNVAWDSPSEDYSGSMPIGNGDLAANVWVEPTGDVIFYLSKSDAYSGGEPENGPALLKLGRVRLTLDPPLYTEGATFKQKLDLATGSIRIQGAGGRRQGAGVRRDIRFWIDANQPVINVEIDSTEPCTAIVALESWRADGEWLVNGTEKDTILPTDGQTIRWYHRNTHSVFNQTFEDQHLGHLVGRFPDPLIHRTFGGLIHGDNLQPNDDRALVSEEPAERFTLRIHALTRQTETPEEWVAELEQQVLSTETTPLGEAWKEHTAWWEAFWDRSHIDVYGTPEAEAVSRAYQLQRWVAACAGRGAYPIKFNGSLFTVDAVYNYHVNPEGEHLGPDARRWGNCYWFQNTRHSYWPMLYCGDYDMMQPLFKMYRDALPLLRERTRHYFKHDGVFFTETLMLWGLDKCDDYTIREDGIYQTSTWTRYYWQGGLELSAMMLDCWRHTQDESLVRDTLLPIVDEVVLFYDQHYPKLEDGKRIISPAQVLESWHEAENPAPVIIGLRTVLSGLLALPEAMVDSAQRIRWAQFLEQLPELPTAEEGGRLRFIPAKSYDVKRNSETGELYCVFPYNAYSLASAGSDMKILLETYEQRLHKHTGCWRYDAILAAMLGLTADAKAFLLTNVLQKFHTIDPVEEAKVTPSRFPVFYHTGDWVPDQDHASINMTALQRMLMVVDEQSIYLLSAWPDDWNASFKLHAPYQTVVEGRVEKGEIVHLKVTPESREKNVMIVNA